MNEPMMDKMFEEMGPGSMGRELDEPEKCMLRAAFFFGKASVYDAFSKSKSAMEKQFAGEHSQKMYYDMCNEISTAANVGTTNCAWSSLDLEELYAMMGKHLISIPKGPSICPSFHQPKEPELYCCEHIDTDQAFVIAGMGVVAGEEAFKKLNDGNTILRWE